MFSISWNLVDFETVISGALPSPNATGVYEYTIIPIHNVFSAHARKEQIINSPRIEIATHPLVVTWQYPLDNSVSLRSADENVGGSVVDTFWITE